MLQGVCDSLEYVCEHIDVYEDCSEVSGGENHCADRANEIEDLAIGHIIHIAFHVFRDLYSYLLDAYPGASLQLSKDDSPGVANEGEEESRLYCLLVVD